MPLTADVSVAQRRPERQPRRHTAGACADRRRYCDCSAQRRPERQPRRHTGRLRVGERGAYVPLNEGRSVNPGDTGQGPPTGAPNDTPVQALNEGRSVNPGDTSMRHGRLDWGSIGVRAQRRPERQPRRHSGLPAYDEQGRRRMLALNEGRSVNPGDTPSSSRRHRDLEPVDIAQRRPERQPRRHDRHEGVRGWSSTPFNAPLNEGRSVNPGDTWSKMMHHVRDTLVQSLNEGRSVNPGDTAKFCKRAVPGQTIARPRAREPRRRRVCGHFTRFRTLPRQNRQDQAVETALTAAEHTRFPRITEGSQMSQSTQGWPSS